MQTRSLPLIPLFILAFPACSIDGKLCIGDCDTVDDGTGTLGGTDPSTGSNTATDSDSTSGPADACQLPDTIPGAETCGDGVVQAGELCFIDALGIGMEFTITSSVPVPLDALHGADLLLSHADDSISAQLFAPNTSSSHPWPLPIGEAPQLRAGGDLDEDGVVDVLAHTHGPDGFSIHALLLDGAGGLVDDRIVLVTDSLLTLDAVDWNDDGHLDVVTVGDAQPGVDNLVVLLGDGTGQFSATAGSEIEFPSARYTLGALDPDGLRNDFVFFPDSSAEIYRHTGGVLIDTGAGSPAELDFHSFAIGDVDQDGLGDLVGVATNVDDDISEVVVFPQLANGDHNYADRYPVHCGARLVALADLDSDGRLDIVTVGVEGSATIRRGDGDGGFAPVKTISFEPMDIGDRFHVADFEGDGSPDLVGTNSAGTYVFAPSRT